MNKTTALLLVLALLFCTGALAEEAAGSNPEADSRTDAEITDETAEEPEEAEIAPPVYDKPIYFRGAEWGAAIDSVLKCLPEGVMLKPVTELIVWYPIESMMYNYLERQDAEIGCSVSAEPESLKGVKVAGYELDGISLNFAHTADAEGRLVYDEEHTAFCYGAYQIRCADCDAAFDDLTAKLSSLYGDVGLQIAKPGYISYYMNLWYGQEGTMVSVYLAKYVSSSLLYVKYGTKAADEYAQAALAALNSAQPTDIGDVDGL